MKFLKMFVIALAMALFVVPAIAQTGITVDTGTNAVAVHKNGSWAAADVTYVQVPFWDSSADTSGYINNVALRGDAFVPDSSMGFNYYGVGLNAEPTKLLDTLLGTTLIPADSVRFDFHGTVGSFIPSSGSSKLSGMLGATVSYALNDSGSVTWNVVEGDYLPQGTWGISSGIRIFVTGNSNAQSVKATKARRLLAKMDLKK
ncbi:Uncharacterised protein [uncultured archaeon]|nr:Uncharacterised protein [uncultured archaeon]